MFDPLARAIVHIPASRSKPLSYSNPNWDAHSRTTSAGTPTAKRSKQGTPSPVCSETTITSQHLTEGDDVASFNVLACPISQTIPSNETVMSEGCPCSLHSDSENTFTNLALMQYIGGTCPPIRHGLFPNGSCHRSTLFKR